MSLTKSPDVAERSRATFHAIERASRAAPASVAVGERPGPDKQAALAP